MSQPTNLFSNTVRSMFLAAGLVLVALSAPVSAEDSHPKDSADPTLADYNAAMKRLAMAKLQAEIEQASAGGSSNDVPRGALVSPPPQAMVPPRPARPEIASDPTVVYVRPSDKGGVAQLAMADGSIIDASVGKTLPGGAVVTAVGSDVVIKDKNGTRSLPWGGGSSVAAPAQNRGTTPVPAMPGAPTFLPPPSF